MDKGAMLKASIPCAGEYRIGRRAAQAYLDDPRHATNPRTREIMDEHFARCHSAAVVLARECLLNLIAGAKRFDEDVDGDEVNGRTVRHVDYHITTSESQLRELAEVLGITPNWGETVGAALCRIIEEDAAQAIEAGTGETLIYRLKTTTNE